MMIRLSSERRIRAARMGRLRFVGELGE